MDDWRGSWLFLVDFLVDFLFFGLFVKFLSLFPTFSNTDEQQQRLSRAVVFAKAHCELSETRSRRTSKWTTVGRGVVFGSISVQFIKPMKMVRVVDA